jgi:hypothetical protein
MEKEKRKRPPEDEMYLLLLHNVFEEQMQAKKKTRAHIVNGNTHYTYANLRRDKKENINSRVLTLMKKGQPVGVELEDVFREVRIRFTAYLKKQEEEKERKRKEILRGG